MEKSRSEILTEIKESLESLKAQVAELESRISAFEAEPEEETVTEIPAVEVDPGPIDISLDDFELDGDIPAGEMEPAVKAAQEETPETAEVPEAAAVPEEKEPLESILSETPKESINDKQVKVSRKAVMDVMSEKCAWRTAIPGTPVKNIISAISLNDRVLFINTLFREDPMVFQDALSALNAMSSFAEAEEYIRENYPEWNLNSDIVYRMMMAIRRKLK